MAVERAGTCENIDTKKINSALREKKRRFGKAEPTRIVKGTGIGFL